MSTPPAKHKHLMIDIETMGDAILSVGAVPFSIHPERMEIESIDRSFYAKVPLRASLEAGMNLDPNTVEWWLQQDKAAQDELLSGARFQTLRELCLSFHDFFSNRVAKPADMTLWDKPPMFDIRLMREAFELAAVVWPFHYAATRDVRVILDVAKAADMTAVLELVNPLKHSALGDARHQAQQVVMVMSALMPKLEF